MGLLEVFSRIVDEQGGKEEVGVKELTYFICSGISDESTDTVLLTKEVPSEKFCIDPLKPRDLEVNPATIYSHPDSHSLKISKGMKR